jgi:hypothetical protein
MICFRLKVETLIIPFRLIPLFLCFNLVQSPKTTNWMVYLNLPDLFGRGNLGGIYVGQPPKIVSSNLSFGNVPSAIGLNGVAFGAVGSQPASTTHVELFYRYRISDNINITPGVIFLFNPVHTSTSDTITIGTIRTTFTF